MKNIKNYKAEKYLKKGLSLFKKRKYNEVEPEIYEYKEGEEVLYVTSLSFDRNRSMKKEIMPMIYPSIL